jgi:hypothetical protein
MTVIAAPLRRLRPWLIASALALPLTAWAAPPQSRVEAAGVETLGIYSNVRITGSDDDPHAEGYDCELYRENGQVFGLFYSSQGMVGDTPRGRLQDVRYDPAKRRLFFRAKLTLGQEITRDTGSDGRPSRDLFEFDGTLDAKRLSGTLTHRDGHRPAEPGERETVSLKLDRERSAQAREFAPSNRKAWQAEDLPMGPQW